MPLALPKSVRRLTPTRLRDDVRLRSVMVGTGLIPPRTMHSDDDAAVLRAVAQDRRNVVELGVYEGSSAILLCDVLEPTAHLHLVDPYGHHPDALRPGWGATEWATRRAVGRAARRLGGPMLHWHVELSAALGARWSEPVDLVFIDGDHSAEGVAADWSQWSPHVVEGGAVLFHDARESQPGGRGLPGPTAVVDRLFRGGAALEGWRIDREADRSVAVVRQSP